MQKLTAKRAIKSVAAALRLGTIRSARSAGSVNILAYHRVVADIQKAEQTAYYGLVVSTETFRHHCKLLKETFDVVPLDRAYAHLTGNRPSHRPLAVITFDDGYLDFYEQAFPVLLSLDLTATVFLPTECIGKDEPLDHDRLYWLLTLTARQEVDLTSALERAGVTTRTVRRFAGTRDLPALTEKLVHLPIEIRARVISELERKIPNLAPYPPEYKLLNWEQIREMSGAGISFGGHTANHVVLPLESAPVLESEIIVSKGTLERELDKIVTSFAYPNGAYNTHIKSLIERAGYKIAVTTEKRINRPGVDLFALGRTSLCEESTRGLKGNYSAGVANLRLGV